MPKGADLHNHVAGAIYAENLIEAAAQESLCVDEHALSIVKPANGACANAQTATVYIFDSHKNSFFSSAAIKSIE